MEGEKKKVLIIDDDTTIADMYLLKFRREGFDADAVTEAANALSFIQKKEPDVILLDIVMSHMDGFEILSALNSMDLKKKPKVIFLTNVGQKEEAARGLKLGAEDYIVKANFTPSEVVEKVKKVLGG